MKYGDLISREEAIKIASGYCHPANIADELAKLPSASVEAPKPTGDLISRADAIEAICEHGTDLERRGITALAVANHKQVTVDLLETLPSAERTGTWIRHKTNKFGPKLNDCIECSQCGIWFSTENLIRRTYCPNCGSYNGGKNERFNQQTGGNRSCQNHADVQTV